MNTIEAIKTRRAVKLFNSAHRMSTVEITELLSLAVLSPTAFNIQNWRFVVVDKAELRKKIREVAWDQTQVTEASLLIVLCADLKTWEKQPVRYWKNAPQGIQDFMLPAIDSYYRGKEQVQRDEAMRSCGIAAQTIMLAAKSLVCSATREHVHTRLCCQQPSCPTPSTRSTSRSETGLRVRTRGVRSC